MNDLLIPFAAFAGGIVTKTLSDWLSANFVRQREQEARTEVRRDVLRQRRTEFQRETLLALQDACMNLIRASGQINHYDVINSHKTGQWQKDLLPDGISERFREAQAATTTLSVRVRDDEVRRLVDDLKGACAVVGRCGDEAASDRYMEQTGTIHQDLNSRIGQILRTIDLDEEPICS